MGEIYSGADCIVKVIAYPTTPPVDSVEHLRSIEIDEKADADSKPDSDSDGWDASVGGNAEWDATLNIFIPYGTPPALIGGIGGNVSDLAGSKLAHVRKITRSYANSVSKAASSDTDGWKMTTKGTNSYKVSIDCYADAANFTHGTPPIKAGDAVLITTNVNGKDVGSLGPDTIVIERIGGFKAGVEGGNIGFTIEGRGNLEGDIPVVTPFVLGELFNLAILPIGEGGPEIAGTARVSAIDDFVTDIEGVTFVGVSIKFAGHGALVRVPE